MFRLRLEFHGSCNVARNGFFSRAVATVPSFWLKGALLRECKLRTLQTRLLSGDALAALRGFGLASCSVLLHCRLLT